MHLCTTRLPYAYFGGFLIILLTVTCFREGVVSVTDKEIKTSTALFTFVQKLTVNLRIQHRFVVCAKKAERFSSYEFCLILETHKITRK